MFLSCSETKTYSPAETAKIVATSFYHDDAPTMKKHTTAAGYSNLLSIQALFLESDSSKMNFKIIDETADGDVTWIKYRTDYDPTPGVFKLIQEDNQWKVTYNGPRDRGPF